ncbi:hypothetical protein UB46_23490 [Burkholderiaceae bacterium 16]|nr:hypothetical protein UB46_23490 [Burkholderiaceae bacterium 16]
MTKERPILFSAPMVRAILDGRKTQTRRMLNPQPVWDPHWGSAAGLTGAWRIGSPAPMGLAERGDHWSLIFDDEKRLRYPTAEAYGWGARAGCPYGQPGDRLWVRKSWRVGKPHDKTPPRDILPLQLAAGRGVTVLYAAGGARSIGPAGRIEPTYPDDAPMPNWAGKGRPSIHTPRALSRIVLELTGVRVERLNDCSEADAIAEGIAPELDGWTDYSNPSCQMCTNSVNSYRTLWDSINGAGAWEANPWVWVVEFRRVQP